MDATQVTRSVEAEWNATVHDTLCKYIAIPNQSPLFDPDCHKNGYQEQAAKLLFDWAIAQNVKGLTGRIVQDQGRTPLIFMTVEATGKSDKTVLLYGHMDKQPPMTENWSQGLHPHKPVFRDGKLYGRGGADDGYSIFAAILSIKALHEQNLPHARLVIVIEGCEESGSPDLMYYIEKLKDEIGSLDLVICLDSGCGNYDQLWMTTSLRGLVVGTLSVKVLTEAVHSGGGSGIVPSSMRIVRSLLDRLEDAKTGEIHVKECYVNIPEKHVQYAKQVADTLGPLVYQNYPFVKGAQPISHDLHELCLNKTWRPTVCYTGVDGIPSLASAGNVLRTHTKLKLSIRLPPTADAKTAAAAIRNLLTVNPPYGAEVSFDGEKASNGWMAPEMVEWLEHSVAQASRTFFKHDPRYWGEGGSIPFMGMLGERFPGVQFVITGVLGPQSNAHGPDEMLNVQAAQRVSCCMTQILADHYENTSGHDPKRRRK